MPEKQKDQSQIKNKKTGVILSFLWRCLVALVLAAVVLTNLFTHVVQIVNYHGIGMEPALEGGRTLVILKNQKVEEGDIIAFYYNNQVLVRRVICEGGKQLEMKEDGTVLINDAALSEPYVKEFSLGQCNIQFPYQVQMGTVFVMGDNRTAAMDSRLTEIGTIPVDRIIGKVIFVF